jgi:hypothetical protein
MKVCNNHAHAYPVLTSFGYVCESLSSMSHHSNELLISHPIVLGLPSSVPKKTA